MEGIIKSEREAPGTGVGWRTGTLREEKALGLSHQCLGFHGVMEQSIVPEWPGNVAHSTQK